MKKTLIGLLALCLVLSVSLVVGACGDEETTTSESVASATTVAGGNVGCRHHLVVGFDGGDRP